MAGVSVLVFAGFVLRWNVFSGYYNVSLEGDAPGYFGLAHLLSWTNPWFTGVREPAFIWLLKLGLTFFGDSERSARFMTLIFSCALIPLTYLLARASKQTALCGITAAGLTAFNPFSIFMSVQGLQLELFTALVLIFSYAWLKEKALVPGLAGAILSVTRIQSVLAVVPLALFDVYKSKKRFRTACLFLVPVMLILVPYLAVVKHHTGSFTANLDHVARYFQKAEQGNPDTAGGVMERKNITLGEYIFSKKSLLVFSRRFFEGYLEILFNPLNPFNKIFLNSHYARNWNLIFLPFFWFGLAKYLLSGDNRRFLLLPALFMSVLPAWQNYFAEPRLLFHVAPFFAVITAHGMTSAASRAGGFCRRTSLSRFFPLKSCS